MMRRTKEDEFMGKPLIELPPKEVKQVFIQFDPDSRALYTMYEELARSSINDLAMVRALSLFVYHHFSNFSACRGID